MALSISRRSHRQIASLEAAEFSLIDCLTLVTSGSSFSPELEVSLKHFIVSWKTLIRIFNTMSLKYRTLQLQKYLLKFGTLAARMTVLMTLSQIGMRAEERIPCAHFQNELEYKPISLRDLKDYSVCMFH